MSKKRKQAENDRPEQPSGLVGLSHYPRAAASIRRAKSMGGLAGFGLALVLGHVNGAPFETSASRAIAAGTLGYLIAWAAAVSMWRHLLRAQAREAAARARARREARA